MWQGEASSGGAPDGRALIELVGTLTVTLLLTWLLLWASRHFNALAVTHFANGGYSARPAHPHLAHWFYVAARALALASAGVALYRSPLFVAKGDGRLDRKSTRLNSSHITISY